MDRKGTIAMGFESVYVVGSGKLAQAILAHSAIPPQLQVERWSRTTVDSDRAAIVLHAGSGREMAECLGFCSRTRSIFLQLSTGQESPPPSPGFPYVVCPNTSILVLKLLSLLRAHPGIFREHEISLTESHQATKSSEPGTAFAFADSLGIPREQIHAIRDPKTQTDEIGIPVEHLSAHAWHRISLRDAAAEITLETRVLGLSPYAEGAWEIVQAARDMPLEGRTYSVLDVLEASWSRGQVGARS